MIIVEFIVRLVLTIWYGISRFFIWIITARDCRHCIHRQWYLSVRPHWFCGLTHIPDREACLASPWRVKFKRDNLGKERLI